MVSQERFRPPSHTAPDSFTGKLVFCLRWLVDFQFNTIYALLSRELPTFRGKIMDIGCGNCPFEHLVNSKQAEYIGLDVVDAAKWDYTNEKIITYDGKHLPFPTESIDHFICTEVLEHVAEPHELIADMHRVVKAGGTGIITIPWSARFHYKPYDYHRYTPTMLAMLFTQFTEVTIINRGTDISAIVNKSIVLYMGMLTNLMSSLLWLPVKIVLLVLLAPLMGLLTIWGHLALWFNWGSADDPLGYTIILRK